LNALKSPATAMAITLAVAPSRLSRSIKPPQGSLWLPLHSPALPHPPPRLPACAAALEDHRRH
jgi:hypothetical protein